METPNIQEGYEIVNEIAEISRKLAEVKLKIYAAKSAIVTKVLSEQKYWINGKPPSMSLIEKTYLLTGIDGVDLISIYREKENLQTQLDYLKAKLEIFKLEVEIWRTQSANERVLN